MQITEVRIKLCEENHERLLAFCSVTFENSFVIRDLKVIEGSRGLFVAMPSRKLMDRCNSCGCKNHLRARFCNNCGRRLDEARAVREGEGRAKLHADIAHPIHSNAREHIQAAIAKAYQDEKQRAKQPGYVCRYDDYEYDYEDDPMSYGDMVKQQAVGYKSTSHGPPSRVQNFHPPEVHSARISTNERFGAGIEVGSER